MSKNQGYANDGTSTNVDSTIENLMYLMIQEKWNEARTKWAQELASCPNNMGLISILPFINKENNLIDDKTFRNELAGVSAELHSLFEEIRNRALSNHYLKECMDVNHVSDEKDLCYASIPLFENASFIKSFGYASEKRKEQMLLLQHNQAEEILKQCIKKNSVSSELDLQHIPSPLADDILFQTALKYVSNERQKNLLTIQQNQVEHFLQLCMKANSVDREDDLQYTASPLTLNEDFKKALNYASPKRQKQLQKIQFCQAKNKLKDFLLENKHLLAYKKEALDRDDSFQQLLQFASPELQDELKKIQLEQKETNLVEKDVIQLYSKVIQESPDTMFRLFICYKDGDGISKDPEKAMEWLCKAAENGHSEAMYNLSKCYENGDGISKDPEKAMEWLHEAVENGHSEAAFQLGTFYYNGKGKEQDFKKAFDLFLKAVECNHPKAMYFLYLCYKNGKGVEKDKVKAWKWLGMAAKQGDSVAKKEYEGISNNIKNRLSEETTQREGWWRTI